MHFSGQYLLQIRLCPKISWADELGLTLLQKTIAFTPPHPAAHSSAFAFQPLSCSLMTEACFAFWKAALKTPSLIIEGCLF